MLIRISVDPTDIPDILPLNQQRRDGRVVEGAPLLREYGTKSHRGFESLSLRQRICARSSVG